MKNFDATPSPLNDVSANSADADIELNYIVYRNKSYAEKFKHYLRKLSLIGQTALLWALFLYIPVYGFLLYFNVVSFISIFSLCYFLSFIVIILIFGLINREEHTFNK